MKNTPKTKDIKLLEQIRSSILKVLKNDGRAMPLKVLMHKVFGDLRTNHQKTFIEQRDFFEALNELIKKYLVGKNKFDKYFIDYLDLEETDIFGEGYIEIDPKSGNGYITIKKFQYEYKKSSHFVHKKNLNGAKFGDYVKFCELKVKDKRKFSQFPLIDARVKKILPKPETNKS